MDGPIIDSNAMAGRPVDGHVIDSNAVAGPPAIADAGDDTRGGA